MNYERSNSRKQGHVELMLYNVLCTLTNSIEMSSQVSGSCGPQSARAQFIVDAQTSSSSSSSLFVDAQTADCHENTGQQGK